MFGLRCLHLHTIRMATMKTASRRIKATEAGTAIRMIMGNGKSGTCDELFPDSGVLVFAGDGGDVVAGGGVVVGGGGGVMMVSCGHAELLVWNLTSARCNQLLENRNSRARNRWVYLVCMQYLTKCSQEVTWMS